MSNNETYDPFDGLAEAYETMYEYVADDLHKTEDISGPLIHDLIDGAKDKIIEIEEIAEEDAEKLAAWLRRDLDEAINYVSESEYTLKDWLGFETSVVKNAMIHTLLETADKATLALLRMKKNSHEPYDYHTGEVAGFGTLICDECGEKLHFHKAGKIPPCPKCHKTSFHRIQVD